MNPTNELIRYASLDPRCQPDCDIDPFNLGCPPDCEAYSGIDPRCPVDCNKMPLHPKCPADCDTFTGKDERCPCSDRPTHPGCPPICNIPKAAEVDPRCPPDCSETPFHAKCPANCTVFAGKDPRCPCSENPFSDNCPPDCARWGNMPFLQLIHSYGCNIDKFDKEYKFILNTILLVLKPLFILNV